MRTNTLQKLSLYDDFIFKGVTVIRYLMFKGNRRMFHFAAKAHEYYRDADNYRKYEQYMFLVDYAFDGECTAKMAGHVRNIDEMLRWLDTLTLFSGVKSITVHAVHRRLVLPLLKVPAY